MKEKDAVTKKEQDSTVATEKPSIATEAQLGARSSAAIQLFFRANLRAIKDK